MKRLMNISAMVVAGLLMAAIPVQAANITKANTTNMNAAADWGGSAPNSGNLGILDNTISAANEAALTLGGNVSLQGLLFNNSLNGPVTVANTGGYTLSLYGSGIDMNAANRNVTLNSLISLAAAQSWINGAAGLLSVGGDIDNGSFLLTVNGPGNTTLSGILGSGVTKTGGLTKNGRGSLTLNGSSANLYTGLTTVNSGTLILGKTGGAIAVPTNLTVGAGTGLATVRLDAAEQIIPAATLIFGYGGTLNLNGNTQTVSTISTMSGGTISGGAGKLILAGAGATTTINGANTVSSVLQLTGSAAAQTRTIKMDSSVLNSLTISGRITDFSGGTGGLTLTGAGGVSGILTLSGDNDYTGPTSIAIGILNIRSTNALGSTASGTTVQSGTTLQIQGGITTANEPLSIVGSEYSGKNGINIQRGALVNVSGVNNYAGLLSFPGPTASISSDSGTLNLTNPGTITGVALLTLTGAGDGSISSILGTGVGGGVIKNGTGTWTLNGANTSGNGGSFGPTTISAGTLKLGDGAGNGTWTHSNMKLIFSGGCGTFEFAGTATGQTQGFNTLTPTDSAGTVKIDVPGTSGNNQLTFASLAATSAGAALNFVAPAGSPGTKVVFTAAPTVTKGVIGAGTLFFNGADFTSYSGGQVVAASYTDEAAALASGLNMPTRVTGDFTQGSSLTVDSGIKFASARTLTIGNGALVTINNAANSSAGILVTGGNAVSINDQGTATGLTTGGSGTLVLRTDTASDSLTINAPLTSGTLGGIAKAGAGTVTLNAVNGYTGTTYVDEGTLKLGNTNAMAATAATVQIGGALDLNGQAIANAVTLNGTGVSGGGALINSSGTAASVGAITIGAGFGTGAIGASIGGANQITSSGVLAGNNILDKVGAGTLILTNASTRTGVTQIDAGTLRLQAATGITPIGTGAFILNGGILSLGFDAANALITGAANVTTGSTVIADRNSSGAGNSPGTTLGALNIAGAYTLTVQGGGNVASGTEGMTFGSTTFQGNPTFDVQNPTTGSGATLLTLGGLNDLGVARTITFQNTGAGGSSASASSVTLGTAATTLIDGTAVNVNAGANKGITVNLNNATALGSLAQVTLTNSGANVATLSLGAAQTIGSLAGNGTVTASGSARTLTIGNTASSSALNTTFSGTLSDGSGAVLSVIKDGYGTQALSGSSGFTGTTAINNGTLIAGHASALGPSGNITVAANATLAVGAGVTFAPGARVTFSSGASLAGQGTYNKTANWTTSSGLTFKPGLPAGTLTVDVGGGTLTFGANNTLSIVVQPDGTYGKLLVNGTLDISASTARLVVTGTAPAGEIVLAEGTTARSGQFSAANVDLSGLNKPCKVKYTSTQVILAPSVSGTVVTFR